MWQKVAKFKGAEYFRKALYYIVACESIHPRGIFPILLPYNLELKYIFLRVCVISFKQHAYHFGDEKYILL